MLRPQMFGLAPVLMLAACGSPPQRPVIVNMPTAPTTVVAPTAPAESPLVSQCRDLFARSLGNPTAAYSQPVVASQGSLVTVEVAATLAADPSARPLQYSCSFKDGILVSAGRT